MINPLKCDSQETPSIRGNIPHRNPAFTMITKREIDNNRIFLDKTPASTRNPIKP